jgi:hypothetical protein
MSLVWTQRKRVRLFISLEALIAAAATPWVTITPIVGSELYILEGRVRHRHRLLDKPVYQLFSTTSSDQAQSSTWCPMALTNAAAFVSNIVAILEVAEKHYIVVRGDSRLREAFHGAGQGLSTVKNTLMTAHGALQGHKLPIDGQPATNMIDTCKTNATLSERILKEVAEAPERSRAWLYAEAVRKDDGERLEVLVLSMMNEVCNFAQYPAIKDVMVEQVEALRNAMELLRNMGSSVVDDGPGTFNNLGPGKQFNNTGGTQHNVMDNAKQFFGNFSGEVTFN